MVCEAIDRAKPFEVTQGKALVEVLGCTMMTFQFPAKRFPRISTASTVPSVVRLYVLVGPIGVFPFRHSESWMREVTLTFSPGAAFFCTIKRDRSLPSAFFCTIKRHRSFASVSVSARSRGIDRSLPSPPDPGRRAKVVAQSQMHCNLREQGCPALPVRPTYLVVQLRRGAR
jgi:hypothetical protein